MSDASQSYLFTCAGSKARTGVNVGASVMVIETNGSYTIYCSIHDCPDRTHIITAQHPQQASLIGQLLSALFSSDHSQIAASDQ